MEEFKCLEVLSMDNGGMEPKTNRGLVNSNMGTVTNCCGQEMATAKSKTTSLSLFQTSLMITWIMTGKRKSYIQVTESSCILKVAGLDLWMKLCEVLHIKEKAVCWGKFVYLIRIGPGRFPLKVFQAHPTGSFETVQYELGRGMFAFPYLV